MVADTGPRPRPRAHLAMNRCHQVSVRACHAHAMTRTIRVRDDSSQNKCVEWGLHTNLADEDGAPPAKLLVQGVRQPCDVSAGPGKHSSTPHLGGTYNIRGRNRRGTGLRWSGRATRCPVCCQCRCRTGVCRTPGRRSRQFRLWHVSLHLDSQDTSKEAHCSPAQKYHRGVDSPIP